MDIPQEIETIAHNRTALIVIGVIVVGAVFLYARKAAPAASATGYNAPYLPGPGTGTTTGTGTGTTGTTDTTAQQKDLATFMENLREQGITFDTGNAQTISRFNLGINGQANQQALQYKKGQDQEVVQTLIDTNHANLQNQIDQYNFLYGDPNSSPFGNPTSPTPPAAYPGGNPNGPPTVPITGGGGTTPYQLWLQNGGNGALHPAFTTTTATGWHGTGSTTAIPSTAYRPTGPADTSGNRTTVQPSPLAYQQPPLPGTSLTIDSLLNGGIFTAAKNRAQQIWQASQWSPNADLGRQLLTTNNTFQNTYNLQSLTQQGAFNLAQLTNNTQITLANIQGHISDNAERLGHEQVNGGIFKTIGDTIGKIFHFKL